MFSHRPCIYVCAVLAFAFATTGRSRADSVALFNTGVDSSGNPLSVGTADPHWSIVAGPGISSPIPGVVVNNGTYAQSSASSWIWVNGTGSGATGTPYTFRLTFNLTGIGPASVALTGNWGVDNNGSIDLNGAAAIGTGALSLSGGGSNNFGTFHAFSITGGFVAGANTLDFLAEDDANPGALNVTDLKLMVNSVPEPASLVLLFTGLAGLAAMAGRGKTKFPARTTRTGCANGFWRREARHPRNDRGLH